MREGVVVSGRTYRALVIPSCDGKFTCELVGHAGHAATYFSSFFRGLTLSAYDEFLGGADFREVLASKFPRWTCEERVRVAVQVQQRLAQCASDAERKAALEQLRRDPSISAMVGDCVMPHAVENSVLDVMHVETNCATTLATTTIYLLASRTTSWRPFLARLAKELREEKLAILASWIDDCCMPFFAACHDRSLASAETPPDIGSPMLQNKECPRVYRAYLRALANETV